MFAKVLVANRGAVAARILRALNEMQVKSVAVYSDADSTLPYLERATESYGIGPASARESYLNQEAILDVLKRSGADALHPGYGFLSENASFAQRVIDAGVAFIGPAPRWIDCMGHKTRAREIAAAHGMPMSRGSNVLSLDGKEVLAAARAIGYPVLVKPAAGGGGIGMLPVNDESELLAVVERSRSMANRGFGNEDVYLERLLEKPRHIEFQILGDQHGNAVHLFERDCSVQRRNQKVIEEATAPGLERAEVDGLARQLVSTMRTLGYDNIGTIEMLRAADGSFNFLEMNTRLQVEHGVTEEITGVDLVKAQIRAASGERLTDFLPPQIRAQGHAIQARVYAEDPVNFYPSPGTLNVFSPPKAPGVRVESGFTTGCTVTSFYDPMLAKVIVWADTRIEAIARLIDSLESFEISGLKHNIPAILAVLRSDAFRSGDLHTGLIAQVRAESSKH